jgi:hypothetical protein
VSNNQNEADTKRFKLEELGIRQIVMDATLKILCDGQPHTARDILDQLKQQGFRIPKRLVNSILFSEARRYVKYNKSNFTYQLKELEEDGPDKALEKVDVASTPVTVNIENPATNEIKATLISRNDEYLFKSSPINGPVLFETEAISHIFEIKLNENHPLYSALSQILSLRPSDSEVDDLCNQLDDAQNALELLLAAWAKYEHDQPEGPRRRKVEEARIEWGRNARLLALDDMDED